MGEVVVHALMPLVALGAALGTLYVLNKVSKLVYREDSELTEDDVLEIENYANWGRRDYDD